MCILCTEPGTLEAFSERLHVFLGLSLHLALDLRR